MVSEAFVPPDTEVRTILQWLPTWTPEALPKGGARAYDVGGPGTIGADHSGPLSQQPHDT
jgi:hypothetical protein